jgi:predicted DNA-binding WGR domain protein
MVLRLKNTSSVGKLFGLSSGFGAFANNEIIKNNPQLLAILLSKETRVSFKKKSYLNPKLLKLNNSNQVHSRLGSSNAKNAAKIVVATKKDNDTVRNKNINLSLRSYVELNTQIPVENQIEGKANNGNNAAIADICNDIISSVNIELSKESCLNQNAYRAYQWRSAKKDRYYNIYLQPTLIGNYSLTKSWGGLHNHLGNYKIVFFDTLEEAYLEIDKISKHRESRGYISAKINEY